MTRDNVERKQARTEDERIEDEDDEFIEEEEEGKSSIFLFCNQVTYPTLTDYISCTDIQFYFRKRRRP